MFLCIIYCLCGVPFSSLVTERSDIDKSAITALDSTIPSVACDAGEYTIV